MKRIAVLTGAGVSAESGIKTFRDSGGLWENYPVEEVASIEGWHRNPGLMLEFYNTRRKELENSRPNEAHRIIAALESRYKTDVITQNVDNLHEKAGSTHVLHLHGELTKVRPENCYNDRDGFSTQSVFDIGYEPVHLGDKAPNGAQLRPHIVWFGEPVPNIEKAITLVSEADILIIVGTSLQVYPAAGLYRYAGNDTPIYLVDPKPAELRDGRLVKIPMKATEGMRKLAEMLGLEGYGD